jgi:Ala-tRNA(Pro) deacylase
LSQMKVLEFLSECGVDFEVKHHEEAYTAQREAEAQHISGHMFAKTVVVRAGDEYAVLVLPASHRADLQRVEDLLGAPPRMATEDEMRELFPDCDLGAEPPFGSRYGLRTVVDALLTHEQTIAIRASSHKEVALLAYKDFERLEAPQVAVFARQGL